MMDDQSCIRFLQWALPQLGMRWKGFRKVRGQVKKRLAARIGELGLAGLADYREVLVAEPDEWRHLAGLCRISISRFYRDRGVFDALAEKVLPELTALALQRGDRVFRVLSIGCASGEEPYTLALIARFHPAVCAGKAISWEIGAVDADPLLLERAAAACYPPSSVRELPASLRAAGFSRQGDCYCPRFFLRQAVSFSRCEILTDPLPGGPWHLILCRNLAFTYFDADNQLAMVAKIGAALLSGGALVVGVHESLPELQSWFVPWLANAGIFRRLREVNSS